jgi:ATP-dependent Clp protease ATP-binding subunit ClpA
MIRAAADRRGRPASAFGALLDEIEKAHPDLFNILLQVMDNGSSPITTARPSTSATPSSS